MIIYRREHNDSKKLFHGFQRNFGGLEEAVMAENLITTICSDIKTGFIPVRSAQDFFGNFFSSELTDAKNNCLNKILGNFSTHIFTSYHSTMVKKKSSII